MDQTICLCRLFYFVCCYFVIPNVLTKSTLDRAMTLSINILKELIGCVQILMGSRTSGSTTSPWALPRAFNLVNSEDHKQRASQTSQTMLRTTKSHHVDSGVTNTFPNPHESLGSTMQSLLPLVEVRRSQRYGELMRAGRIPSLLC